MDSFVWALRMCTKRGDYDIIPTLHSIGMASFSSGRLKKAADGSDDI